MENSLSRIYAFIDESGAKGYIRDLTSSRDDEIALMVAILMNEEVRTRFVKSVAEAYAEFVSATPTGEKPHIAAAFNPQYPKWTTVARDTRDVFRAELIRLGVPIIYSARRAKKSRELYKITERTLGQAKTQRRNSNIRIPSHPNADRLEGETFKHLLLKLDAYGETYGSQMLPYLDRTDEKILDLYIDNLRGSRQLSQNNTTVKGYDLMARKSVDGSISQRVTDHTGRQMTELDTKFVEEPIVIQDDAPEILAADIVANSLYSHLSDLPRDVFLNRHEAIQGWDLEVNIWGIISNDNMDLI